MTPDSDIDRQVRMSFETLRETVLKNQLTITETKHSLHKGRKSDYVPLWVVSVLLQQIRIRDGAAND